MSRRRLRSFARFAVNAGAAAAVALFLYRQRHLFTGFRSAVADAQWYWILAAFAAEMLSMIPLAQAERIVLRVAGVDAPLGELTAVTFASNAIASSVPAGAAVAQGYAFKRYKHFGADDGEAAWAELASGAIAFAALAGVALAGAIVDAGRAARVVIPIVGIVFAGSHAAAALFRRPDLLCEVVDWIDERLPGRTRGEGIGARVRSIAEQIDDLRPSLRTWTVAYALSALNWFLDVVCLAFAFLALGAPVPWGAILLAFAGTKVVSSIGITPGGLGLVEGGMVATFIAYHVDAATAAAAVVVYRGLTLVGLVGFGWAMVVVLRAQGRHPHQRIPASR
jgi:putative heme transporter